jgi:hypothetical protein
MAERRGMPVAGAEDDGDYPRFATLMALQRPLHLNFVAIIQEVGTHQKQDHVGSFEIGVDCPREVFPRLDAAVMPSRD